MKRVWIVSMVLGGLVLFASTTEQQGAALAAPEPVEAAESDSVSEIRFDINGASSSPQLAQMGPLPEGWTPDDPLDLSGDVPPAEDIREAIVEGIEYLLSEQHEDGHWDVVLTGTLLSQTADEAVDAIATTSLAGIALRYHVNVDPVRINMATRKAAEFVIDRVYRGKLPMYVQYANWRYNLGLKFLHLEYMALEDDESEEAQVYRGELRSVIRRMVSSMLQLQMSNSEAPRLERKRRTRLASRYAEEAMPAKLGVVLFPPTDNEYRGGARVIDVIEDSIADRNGVKVGDRIIEAEGLRVENAYDFYMLETEWLGNQRVSVKLKREDGDQYGLNVQLMNTWPGYLGLKLREGIGDGPIVEGFLPFSPSREKVEIGDVITEIDGEEVKSLEDYEEAQTKLTAGDRTRVYVLRGEHRRRRLNIIETVASPEGWFGFDIEEEDKSRKNGVLVRNIGEESPAARAGIESEDRIMWIGKTPILGVDHLYDFAGTIAGGKTYLIKWLRNGREMEAEVQAEPVPQPFDLQIELNINRQFQVYISDLEPRGAGAQAGFKRQDIIVKINGKDTGDLFKFRDEYFDLSAGEEATFTVQRGARTQDIVVSELPKLEASAAPEVEEGGWAYYPTMGESPSFCTATAILTLRKIAEDVDIDGLRRTLDRPLESASRLVESLRGVSPDHAGAETYAYRAGSLNPDTRHVDLRGCQGRNAVCELALVHMRRRHTSDLRRAISNWVKYRGELDAVRRMEFYSDGRRGSPHNFDRWNNAAYYWLFGHYYTLVAAKECGRGTYNEINEICVKAIMLTRHEDGTWIGHPSFGKTCGTSLALWILGESEGEWREGFDSPFTQEKRDGAESEGDGEQ